MPDIYEDHRQSSSPIGSNLNRIYVGRTAQMKFREEVVKGLLMRAGRITREQNDFVDRELTTVAMLSLEAANQRPGGNIMEDVGRALTTTDFPNILGDVGNKAVFDGFDNAKETWKIWVAKGSVPNFKINTLVQASALQDLDEIPEGTEYKHGGRMDGGEDFKLATYGKLMGMTRQAIVNDDLNALTDVGRLHGEAAARTVGNLAYGVLTSNSHLSDGKTLFHADHKNILIPGAIGTDTIAEAITKMKLQRDLSGKQALNVRPLFIIAPVALEGAAEVFFRSERFDDAAKDATRANIYSGSMFTRVYDPRLDDDNPTQWYCAADIEKTVKMFFLSGQEKPFLESQPGWTVDGMEWKVRIDACATAVDHRGLSRNEGA